MIKIIIFLIVFLVMWSEKIFAASWSYPLENTFLRPQYKKFGQYIDSQFYENTGNLYPTKYTGYHAAVDLEIFPKEKDKLIPVYAITSGNIEYFGDVAGYGGLILQKINTNQIALYGHLNLTRIKLKTGDTVLGGQIIAYLGNAFSKETAGERKHLHFGIYNGNDLYFKGYETNKRDLENKWINPLKFLAKENARLPGKEANVSPTIKIVSLKTQNQIDKIDSKNFLKSISNLFTIFVQKVLSLLTNNPR